MSNITVSVAMATFNGEKFLVEQLDSILNQTRPVDEIVISDDASTDGTVTILEKYQRRHPEIKVYKNRTNEGLNRNFQKAFGYCTGDLITISDQDNIWDEHRVEKLINSFADEMLVYSDSRIMTENGETQRRLSETKKYRFTNGNSPREFFFYNSVFGHNIMFKKELLNYILPIPGQGINYDGWISFVASCVGKMKYIDEPLAYFRLHSDNITHRAGDRTTDEKKKRPKAEKKKEYNHRLIERLTTFKRFKNIPPKEQLFLNEFLGKVSKLDHSFFVISLLFSLLINSEKLFHYKNKLRAIPKAFSQSTGIRYFTLSK